MAALELTRHSGVRFRLRRAAQLTWDGIRGQSGSESRIDITRFLPCPANLRRRLIPVRVTWTTLVVELRQRITALP